MGKQNLMISMHMGPFTRLTNAFRKNYKIIVGAWLYTWFITTL
ncbi:MAG: hypothetical protein ACJ75B_20190 [Flavisolibacter sp.]